MQRQFPKASPNGPPESANSNSEWLQGLTPTFC